MVRSKKGRRLLLLAVTAIAALMLLLIVTMAGAVASVFTDCKEQVQNLSSDIPSSDPSEEALSDIPEDFLKLYREYAEQYGIDWALLAAVGSQETNHGRAESGCATSSTGARGPMQFQPSTWSSEGVDGNGDGTKDPCNTEDAIASGASYLSNLGAGDDPRGALCSYYGACGDANADYANEVMAQAEAYRGAARESSEESGGEGPGGETTSAGLIPPLPSLGQLPQFLQFPQLPQLPSLMDKAYAYGVSDTPAGWSLVEQDKTMTYWSNSRFDSYIEAAVEEWNSLGGVDIQPAESESEANLVFRDVPNSQWQYNWAWGYTDTTDPAATKGEIVIKEEEVETGSETNRKSLMVHEMGHALGFEHQNDKESVMNQNLQTDVPTELDVGIYKETWGGEGSPANTDPSANYGEEEVSQQCKASFWPWS
jgi:hypothetical protein